MIFLNLLESSSKGKIKKAKIRVTENLWTKNICFDDWKWKACWFTRIYDQAARFFVQFDAAIKKIKKLSVWERKVEIY